MEKNEHSETLGIINPPVYHCVSCGLISTKRSAYKLRKGKFICLDCDSDFGVDADVTRWIEQAGIA